MANKIQAKRTSVAGRTPNTTNSSNGSFIDAGEFAVNLADKKVYTSNGSAYFEVGSNVSSISIGSITANGTTGTNGQVLTTNGTSVYWSEKGVNYTLSASPPSNPEAGDVWVDTDDGTRYEYIVEANSSQWVDFTSESAGTPVFIQNSAPTLSGTPYLWIQTGLSGNSYSIWVEDGS